MGLQQPLCVLLCAAALSLGHALGQDGGSDSDRWTRQELPLLLDTRTRLLDAPPFEGRRASEERGAGRGFCGIECQGGLPPVGWAEQERILGYETAYENGTRTHTDVRLQGFSGTLAGRPRPSPPPPTRARRKRQVYGADGRFVISDSRFTTSYPFSSAVRLSSGCSGVLVSPRHVLTAARCLHDGNDYLEGARRLRVGVLQLKSKRGRGRGGRRRGERRRGGGRAATVEEEEENSVDGEARARSRNGRRRGRRERGQAASDGGGGKGRGPGRSRRGLEPGKQPVFRWTRVKQTRIPQGWIGGDGNSTAAADYDYGLLELRRPVGQRPMALGVAPPHAPLTRIHFSGFDADKSLLDGRGGERVVYRFCSVAKESDNLMYQRCDARPGAAGAGVYVRLREEAGRPGGRGRLRRRVIGVFSGHEWVEDEGGELRDFNVAVRITPAKYAQICHWIHGDPSLCREI